MFIGSKPENNVMFETMYGSKSGDKKLFFTTTAIECILLLFKWTALDLETGKCYIMSQKPIAGAPSEKSKR